MMNEKMVNGCGVYLSYKEFSPTKFSKIRFDGFHNRKKNLENDVEFSDEEHPPLILLHGFTNTKETWNDCAQAIANRTDTKVYSLDARNHGDSGWSDKVDYNSLADDVACFMDAMGIPTAIIIGHSMGGLTAMSFAFRHSHRLHSLIVEDISFNSPQVIDEWVRDYMVMLRNVLSIIPPRRDLSEVKRIAAEYLEQEPVTEDIYNNAPQPVRWDGRDLPLRRDSSGEGFEWKTNLNVLQNLVESGEFRPTSLGVVEEDMIFEGPVLIIYGTRSPLEVINDKEEFLKHFPNAVYQAVEGAKHSIHIGFSELFKSLVCDFILKHRYSKCNISRYH